MSLSKLFFAIAIFFLPFTATSQSKNISVIAYYAGSPTQVDSFKIEQLTHIIFSFCHLKGNELHVNNARDTATIQNLVELKKRNPALKVILSLGGWGGCATCSDIFSTKKNRKIFAQSVKHLNDYFQTDGIDLDWEYPAIEGFPSHPFKAEDKLNFTRLVNRLRKTLGKGQQISFAAGGFEKFINQSVEWEKVMKKVDRVNLMTYDLVNGYATVTGHHTPLYSTPQQVESTDHAVKLLINAGIPANKIVIGAAFYARIWQQVPDSGFGLYQSGKYQKNENFRSIKTHLLDSGFIYHWDDIAKAPFLYNPEEKRFATYDDKRSITLKTQYAITHGLDGIMFWQLGSDAFEDGLLQAIDDAKKQSSK